METIVFRAWPVCMCSIYIVAPTNSLKCVLIIIPSLSFPPYLLHLNRTPFILEYLVKNSEYTGHSHKSTFCMPQGCLETHWRRTCMQCLPDDTQQSQKNSQLSHTTVLTQTNSMYITGMFKNSSDERPCDVCPVGTYQPHTRSSACMSCPPNQLSPVNSSSPGSYNVCVHVCVRVCTYVCACICNIYIYIYIYICTNEWMYRHICIGTSELPPPIRCLQSTAHASARVMSARMPIYAPQHILISLQTPRCIHMHTHTCIYT
jgi:hypothetical protein